MTTSPLLISGTAGFIGFHLARRLLGEGRIIVGVDGVTPYYDVALKRQRLALLSSMKGFSQHEFMLEDGDRLLDLFAKTKPTTVVHLAAQAGVRYSIDNPQAYIQSNVIGTFNLLEACRRYPPKHLLIASTSSVYGDGKTVPFDEASETSQPLSLYAATKKATEVMSHAYAHLHGLPTTVFRFFTVYGPWGRPDMALFKFTSAILEGREIEVYGHGEMSRDFTYIDDLIAGVAGLISQPPSNPGVDEPRGASDSPVAPFRVINIGASQPIGLEQFIDALEHALGRKARRTYLPMQAGDVRRTYAETGALRELVVMPPATPLAIGVKSFVEWYLDYIGASNAPVLAHSST